MRVFTRTSERLTTPNPFTVPDSISAYDNCLQLESEPDRTFPNVKLSSQVAARFLGHLLHELYLLQKLEAVTVITDDILCANGIAEALVKLATHTFFRFVVTFHRAGSPTPQPSDHLSRDSLKDEQLLFQALAEPTTDYYKSKALALKRDGYRCVLSGKFDASSVFKGLVQPAGALASTRAVHIIPESMDVNMSGKIEGAAKLRDIWAYFGRFGLPDELNGARIHRLQNILTLDSTLHWMFDTLNMWLKPIPEQPDSYGVHCANAYAIGEAPDTVTFKNHYMRDIPLPDKEYFLFHATACEVAHMAGAAEYAQKIQDELLDTRVLAIDGSSADILSLALSSFA